MLRSEGWTVNAKRVERIWRRERGEAGKQSWMDPRLPAERFPRSNQRKAGSG